MNGAIERRSIQPLRPLRMTSLGCFLSLAATPGYNPWQRPRSLINACLPMCRRNFPPGSGTGLDAAPLTNGRKLAPPKEPLVMATARPSGGVRWAVWWPLLGMVFPQGAGHQTYRMQLMQTGSPLPAPGPVLVHLLQSQLTRQGSLQHEHGPTGNADLAASPHGRQGPLRRTSLMKT